MSNEQPNNGQIEPMFSPGDPVIYIYRGLPVHGTVRDKRRACGRAELLLCFAVDGDGGLAERWVWQSKCRAVDQGGAK